MAYGQTGSGKTFTMFGPENDPTLFQPSLPTSNAGIIPRIIYHVSVSLWIASETK